MSTYTEEGATVKFSIDYLRIGKTHFDGHISVVFLPMVLVIKDFQYFASFQRNSTGDIVVFQTNLYCLNT